jgi:PAS domain S-box-containing protein
MTMERNVAPQIPALAAQLGAWFVTVDRSRVIRALSSPPPLPGHPGSGALLDAHLDAADRAAAAAAVDRALATGDPTSFVCRGGDPPGSRWYRAEVLPAQDREQALIFLRAQSPQSVGGDQIEFQTITERLPDAVALIDESRRIVYLNRWPTHARPEPLLGTPVELLLRPAHRPAALRAIEQVMTTGLPAAFEAQGSGVAWYEVRCVPFTRDTPARLFMLVATDMSERRDVLAALRHSEERLERAIRAAHVGLWEWSAAAGEFTIDTTSLEFVGASSASLVTSHSDWLEAIHPDDRQRVRGTFQTHARGDSDRYEAEYRVRNFQTGEWRWILDRGQLVDAGAPPGERRMVGTHLDVTTRRQAQEDRLHLQTQLQQAQRLEAIGLLAGGIAHDFNNILQVILTNADFARLQVQRGRSPVAELDLVIDAAQRAAALTQQLLTFGRRQAMQVRSVDVVGLGERMMQMLRRTIPANIELRFLPPQDACMAVADPVHLEQVLVNLCLNARDAMPGGGVLTVRVGREPAAPAQKDGFKVKLEVSDTGSGIAPEHLGRIFEPFFTTKAPGAGTGLGLAVVDGIVQQLQGSIRVHSELGSGTTFTVLLPGVSATPDELQPARPTAAPARKELILLAEDEQMVRVTVQRLLEDVGYRVLPARDGNEAVSLFEAHRESIHLAILDVVMPGLNGWEVYQRITTVEPALRVLFTSGYAASALPEDFLSHQPLRFLPKPYNIDHMLATVREILDQPGSRGGTRKRARPVSEPPRSRSSPA